MSYFLYHNLTAPFIKKALPICYLGIHWEALWLEDGSYSENINGSTENSTTKPK